ncbi:MAG: 4-(cytidine 5'-diphospho)-2-C-methyl-D-erythritol kinase [Oscillospiraceae bacterium]
MSVTLREGAFAKINLTLDVLGKRPDGYHDIQSVMQTISIRDDVEVEVGTAKPWTLSCDKEDVPQDSSNLAWKAAEMFCRAAKRDPEGVAIRITKRIPTQAGLGGGSADAAAVLRALNRHYDYPFSIYALAELGAEVGSDVPFCTLGGTVLCQGRGERLRKLPDLPETLFVVCKPDFPVSTPELYRRLDETAIARRPDHTAMEAAIVQGDVGAIAGQLCNVFEPVVTEKHLELNYIKSLMNSYGALGFAMSGSGPSVYAIAPSFEYAAVICTMLKDNYPQVFIAKTV